MKLQRTIEQWRDCVPAAMARQSEAAMMYAFSDARAAILALHARVVELEQRCDALRAALLTCARMAEALKRDCSMDPETPQAIRNGEYQAISTCAHIALGTIRGAALEEAGK
ncbi:MAG: hypothetical protein HY749_15995 [Gammaproteobacteria bacterium]|nr:hypothetical protein [Gammaproteobacteria bacterium]